MSFFKPLGPRGKQPDYPTTSTQQVADGEPSLSPVVATKPFCVCIKALSDTLETFVPVQESSLQVFTQYSQGGEESIVSWHPPLLIPLTDPQKVTSIVNFIFHEYPLCSLDHIEGKYKFNFTLFRNYSGKTAMTNEEEYAVRFVFASRLLKDYTRDFVFYLKGRVQKIYDNLNAVLQKVSLNQTPPGLPIPNCASSSNKLVLVPIPTPASGSGTASLLGNSFQYPYVPPPPFKFSIPISPLASGSGTASLFGQTPPRSFKNAYVPPSLVWRSPNDLIGVDLENSGNEKKRELFSDFTRDLLQFETSLLITTVQLRDFLSKLPANTFYKKSTEACSKLETLLKDKCLPATLSLQNTGSLLSGNSSYVPEIAEPFRLFQEIQESLRSLLDFFDEP